MGTESGFNPATMAMEARCKACGVLVASMTREAQLETRHLSVSWFGILWTGTRNHEEAGCSGNGVE